MTKAAALYSFFSSFGIPAYEENSVYDMEEAPGYPYLTYELNTDAFSQNDTPLTFSLWYRSTSWVKANAKVEEISASISRTGRILECDGGYILIMRGSNFAQSMGDESDNMIKRKLINLTARFYTLN